MKVKEVKKLIGKENWKAFSKFMAGQTVGFDKGIIDYYECDVNRFINLTNCVKISEENIKKLN